ncbi:N-acetylmuramoyl-L-alanine amidase [Alkalihalobacillus oceani]|uniref:N-acetylmuramoyl-L-alanine amidase n=1 Tax=Halalkalibacter oceani TaxID=1653776 RepID=UPI00203CB6CF|nr:N-acetylmuramoyl-L-alanine amidase [Halalkalibacter oceani]
MTQFHRKTAFLLLIFMMFALSPSDAGAEGAKWGTVTSDSSLLVRDQPNQQGSVIGKLDAGEKVEYIPGSNGWGQITYKGRQGFVSLAYLNEAGQRQASNEDQPASTASANQVGTVTADTLLVRSEPSRSSAVIGQLHAGQAVDYTSLHFDWAQITYNGQVGYVSEIYLANQHASEQQSATAETGSSFGTIQKVMIDPGHGGSDPGAIHGTTYEKDINLEIALQIQKALEEGGFAVDMTRTTDSFLSLEERVSSANQANADLFISVHANSHYDRSIKGLETHYYGSRELASILNQELQAVNGSGLRGLYQSDFYVLRNTAIPAFLIEAGYLSNGEDLALLQSPSYRVALAEAVKRAVQNMN